MKLALAMYGTEIRKKSRDRALAEKEMIQENTRKIKESKLALEGGDRKLEQVTKLKR